MTVHTVYGTVCTKHTEIIRNWHIRSYMLLSFGACVLVCMRDGLCVGILTDAGYRCRRVANVNKFRCPRLARRLVGNAYMINVTLVDVEHPISVRQSIEISFWSSRLLVIEIWIFCVTRLVSYIIKPITFRFWPITYDVNNITP